MKNKLFTILKIANVILNIMILWCIEYFRIDSYSHFFNDDLIDFIIYSTKFLLIINAINSIYIIFKKDKNKIKKNQILLLIESFSFVTFLFVTIIITSYFNGFTPSIMHHYSVLLPIIELLMFIDLIISKVKIKN